MKSIADYPVSFGFGATTAPYTKARPHLGEDRKAPQGTPIIVNGVTIGLVGSTGMSSGPHLHVQKVAGGQVVHPKGGGLTIPGPAEVYETGYKASIGNYVRIRDANGTLWSYFHLLEIRVGKGNLTAPKPTGDDMPIPDQDNYYWRYGQKLAQLVRGRQLSREEFRKHIVGKTDLRAVEILSDDPEADGYYALGQWAKANKAKITQQLADQQKQLETQAKEISTLKDELKILSEETIKLTKTLTERPTKEDYDKLVKDNDRLAKQLAESLKRAEEDQPKPAPFSFNDWFSDLLNKIRNKK